MTSPDASPRIVVGKDVDPRDVIDLYASVQWGSESDYTPDGVRRAIENTSIFVTAVAPDGTLVGMTRVFSDGAIVSQVVEVAVRPEYQRQGIGRQMMDVVRHECRGTALYADGFNQNAAFFEQCGFKRPEMAVFSSRNW